MKKQLKRKLFNLWGFCVGWFIFVSDLVPRHKEFIEEYGWLAYQPFTVFVLFFAFGFGKLYEEAQRIADKDAGRFYQLKESFIFSVKMLAIYATILLIYKNILGGKPNLFICF